MGTILFVSLRALIKNEYTNMKGLLCEGVMIYVCTHTHTGEVVLLEDYTVCRDGDTLTPEQARVLVSI